MFGQRKLNVVNFEDILYTPLDVPTPPFFDVDRLNWWIKETYPKQKYMRDHISQHGASAEKYFSGDSYQWDLVVPYYNYFGQNFGWIDGFDKEFPQICEYVFDAFDITPEETGAFVLLPLRPKYSGMGFWHKDIDETGIRWYLDFDQWENDKLFMRKNTDKKQFECEVISKNQAFFLNNVSATHATYTSPESVGKNRIASFILPRADKPKNWVNKAKQLVVRSAEKYKDTYARFV
jgi:hypothetical protein